MKKIIIILCFAIAGFSSLFAQDEIGPALSSQLFSRVNFNPAGIGNDPSINVFSMNRMQWAGFDGAPTYTILNIQGFNERLRSGFGAVFSYDQSSIAKKTINAKVAYNFAFDLSDKALMSFGLSGGILRKGNDFSLGTGHKYEPEVGMPEAASKINPDFDFGIEFSTKKILAGFSINHLGYMSPATSLTPTHAYYAYTRGNFDVTNEIILAPSILFMNAGLVNVVDINAVAFLNKIYWGGLSWRVGGGMGVLLGLQWKGLRVGYAYEASTTNTARVNNNTHELMLSGNIKLR